MAVVPDGLTIPGYEILEELGRGGMGVVYKARHLHSQGLVALKLIRDGALASTQELARFRIEAAAAARMQHPNIVEIDEIGEHNGRPYFAMELIEGGSLSDFLVSDPQPADRSAELVRTLALAVQHAHEQKVVHRDLKPANILLESSTTAIDDADATHLWRLTKLVPKITDFGLAKRLDSESTAWTQDGAVVGTISYMAPEQAEGRTSEIGPAVDVYALGAILYELLTGRPPFQADSWNQTIEQVLRDDPQPPTRLKSDVPSDLETICLKCLEKDRSGRYATARELADDLGLFLQGQPVIARPRSDKQRLARVAARDGFELGEELGRGPRSVVYRAFHGPHEQPVAVKVFKDGICTHEAWDARLKHGANLWSSLAHPHIVPLQQSGWWDRAPYVSLELIPQGSLADRLTGQPYPRDAALRLVEQLAEIVVYIHRQGAVHGNLKPGNVLLAADGIPRVVDFQLTGGLFQSPLPPGDSDPAGLGYLAPEFAEQPDAEPGPYSDIYGLGIVLYELLAGRPPFAGADAGDVLEQVRGQDPVPPSHFNSAVARPLDAVCLRCLRKEPWRRYYRTYDLLKRVRYFRKNPEGLALYDERRRPDDSD